MSRYDRTTVELLLPAVWSESYAFGIRNPTTPDPDMPRGTIDKKAGGALFAHLADIRQAWKRAPIPIEERRALFLRFAFDWRQRDIAANQGVSQRAISGRVERGVGRIAFWLNGEIYEDCVSETDLEVPT